MSQRTLRIDYKKLSYRLETSRKQCISL